MLPKFHDVFTNPICITWVRKDADGVKQEVSHEEVVEYFTTTPKTEDVISHDIFVITDDETGLETVCVDLIIK
jgi:hypothetical protein